MLALGIHLASLPNVLSVLTSQALPQAEAACVHGAVLGLAEGHKKYSMSLQKNPQSWWINSWDKLNTAHLAQMMQGCRAVFINFSHGFMASKQTATHWTLASSVSRVTSIKLFQCWLSFTVSPAVLGCDQISFHRTWLGVT